VKKRRIVGQGYRVDAGEGDNDEQKKKKKKEIVLYVNCYTLMYDRRETYKALILGARNNSSKILNLLKIQVIFH
jgi:hypothetical protein